MSQGRHRPHRQEADGRISKCLLSIIAICVGIIIVKFECERALGVESPGECFILAIIVGVLALLSELR